MLKHAIKGHTNSIEELNPDTIQCLLESEDPRYLHFKDPVVFDNTQADTVLIFSTHPFNWASSNSGLTIRPRGSPVFGEINYTCFPRGFTWDVAISRISGVLKIPKTGAFADLPTLYLYFYDGGESIQNYEENARAVKRPRGYSCEEIGGLAFSTESDFPSLERLSVNFPFFVSPYGTGCSRYIQILQTEEGIYATWQQSQDEFSQPLVLNFLSSDEVKEILS